MRKTKNNYVPAEYGGYLFPKSCLPDILPGDRGKVLTVNNAETEAEWAQAQGGSGIFWITMTETELGQGARLYRLDKTFLEIYTAMQNKMLCVITVIFSGIPPSNYAAKQEIVKEIYYDSHDAAAYVFVNDTRTYSCPTINDYPEFID